jgi:prophage antirepressor-like protein
VCDEVLPSIRKTGGYAKPTSTVDGQISVELAEYVALLKQRAELAEIKSSREQTLAKMSCAIALMRDGNYSREDIAQIADLDTCAVDYLFSDLYQDAAKQGVFSFRMRTH